MRIAVTGSTGKLGRATVERLRADGHDVIGLDIAGAPGPGFTRVDFTDYGQTLDAFLGIDSRHSGLDAVVHLAAIPVNGLVPDVTTFHNNLTVSFNVFQAAMRAGIDTVVYASSITAMGFPFDEAPAALPLDETVTAANNTYGLGKVLEEAMVAQLVRWNPALSITALRFTNVVTADEYGSFARAADPGYRRSLMFSYIDARDGALAVSLALEHAEPGLEVYNIAASDSGSAVPTAELLALHFAAVPVTKELGEFETLMSIDKARSRLGFEPEYLWREQFAG
ncbi:nucleoside-diphosphate-sugar epimerase [Conyzicola lurida]|uniref:Nucleoside-diphosphate-sugar epimerase n=1 Tax=Conyzicola lurida TaxID=1172621 RepID=A0A841AT59_9MICO|nr:NAD(P)-dependent oxidoreductase [Conyzicola lurida]MBB5844775.1 nucleoside-diphosphate-sugar epimerase [Conyzicola lurida]